VTFAWPSTRPRVRKILTAPGLRFEWARIQYPFPRLAYMHPLTPALSYPTFDIPESSAIMRKIRSHWVYCSTKQISFVVYKRKKKYRNKEANMDSKFLIEDAFALSFFSPKCNIVLPEFRYPDA
jgi:hypothetical protein